MIHHGHSDGSLLQEACHSLLASVIDYYCCTSPILLFDEATLLSEVVQLATSAEVAHIYYDALPKVVLAHISKVKIIIYECRPRSQIAFILID